LNSSFDQHHVNSGGEISLATIALREMVASAAKASAARRQLNLLHPISSKVRQ
jgi:hypothetical protein